jgi:hypothetical protein
VVKKWLPGMEVFQPSQAVLLEKKEGKVSKCLSRQLVVCLHQNVLCVVRNAQQAQWASAGTMGHVRHFTLLLLLLLINFLYFVFRIYYYIFVL